MLKIGDFSRLSRVTVKALRYYDEIGLLRPAEVDLFTGYRYYSVSQLPRLNRIVVLKNLGLSLEEIAQLLTDNLPSDQIRRMLRVKQAEIQQRVCEEQERLLRVEELLIRIEKEDMMPAYEVVIKKAHPQMFALVRDVLPTYGDIGQLYGEIFAHIGKHGVAPMGPPMAIYHDAEYRERDVDVEAAVPVGGSEPDAGRVSLRELPAVEQLACVVHVGAFDGIDQAYNALMTWIETNGFNIIGPSREVYLQGPGPGTDPASYVTEVQFPVEKA
ncbi:MAG: MerR family transcriptional regulator [Chloroflexota bacterium]|nr:MerR family transcriptional regulator [Chloroflexota bacterium]